METFLEEFQHLKIQLKEIKSATDNFHESKVIGTGGFGKVYLGEVSHFKGRSMVAFKRLDREFGQGDPEFWKEIMMLSRYTHKNLISLLGFCDEDGEKILIYEYASNGSLDLHLRSATFTWIQRLKACLDAAKGLSYLHDDKGTQQRILHRDIKSSNILLDDNWNAKVSDMGLSKIGPANQPHTAIITNVVGTIGYVDPMYVELGILTKESDVYSFGVVLFEVLCGRPCFENSNGRFMSLVHMWKQNCKHKKLDEIIFRDLMQEMDPGSLEVFSDIAFQCLQKYREKRPTMSLVVEKLKTALELQQNYPFDYEEIIKSAVHPLKYKSEEELKSCLFKGILLNGGKTWFSLNKNGEHCEMISITDCLIPIAQSSTSDRYVSHSSSRFPQNYITNDEIFEFKAHVRAQFLSPQVTYTINLVLKHTKIAFTKPCYLGFRYTLEGETKPSRSCLADVREDGWLMVELYQFESQGRNVDLKISFKAFMGYDRQCLIEGIEFQPIEKVEHEVVEDDDDDDMQTISESDDTYWENKLPNNYDDIIRLLEGSSIEWTTKKELYHILCKGFQLNNDQWFFIAKTGKRCLMLSANSVLLKSLWKWYQSNERFHEYACDPKVTFCIVYEIDSELLSPETTYACYLVYKLPENITEEGLSDYEYPLKVKPRFGDSEFIYLLNPQTPVIRTKTDQSSHNPLNRPKLKAIPRQRNDGWMEVQIYKFQTGTTIVEKFQTRTTFGERIVMEPITGKLPGLSVQGIEFRPM